LAAAQQGVPAWQHPADAEAMMAKLPPLDSPHWTPFDAAGRRYVERRGGLLAAQDMASDLESEALPSMLRRLRPSEGQPERERVSGASWKEDWECTDNGLSVAVKPRSHEVAERYPRVQFCVWGPKLKEILPEPAPVDEREETMAPRKQTGRPPYNWPQIDPVIRYYISDTSAGKPKQPEFIATVRKWCKREGWRVPGPDAIEKRIQHLKKQPFAAD
jgi:hypothetical protein